MIKKGYFEYNEDLRVTTYFCSKGRRVLDLAGMSYEDSEIVGEALIDLEIRGFMNGLEAGKNILQEQKINCRKEYDELFLPKNRV